LTYLKRPYVITMGTFQMAVLLCLNTTLVISVKELQESTQLPEKDLVKQVQSLLDAKILVLHRGNEVDTDKVRIDISLLFFIYLFIIIYLFVSPSVKP
jgi:cullin 2